MPGESGAFAPVSHYAFSFRGKGSEYFRIWIVNLALTILTVGIFSAWAKVRTKRYFCGNTFVADHALDYHASPLRILIGRAIALTLFLGYEISAAFEPIYAPAWLLAMGFAFPWLVNASLRFNARNTSYRNVRFDFRGKYFEAMVAYVLWPIAGFSTLGLLMPAARRARDYFYTNNHVFGGRPFRTQFSAGRIYLIFGIAIGAFLLFLALTFAAIWLGSRYLPKTDAETGKAIASGTTIAVVAAVYFAFLAIGPATHTMIVNLSVNNTTIDGRHWMQSRMAPLTVAWITITNAFLTLFTLGLFYPWAKVRLARYEAEKLSLMMDGDIDSYASEAFGQQSAVGEEIGSVFSFDFGL